MAGTKMLSRSSARPARYADFPSGIRLLTDPVELLVYAGDAGLEQGRPDGVAFPQSAEDVASIVAWAARHHLPLVARGAGTGTSGGALAERGGLVVEFARMDGVLALDADTRTVTVQPGVINQALDDLVRPRGLFYPPDPASGKVCTLGGNIAENAGGPRCCKYGVTTNYVAGLDVTLADGRTLSLGGPVLDCPAYDLVGLLTGSEGTLALTTAATLRLLRVPPAGSMLLGAFGTVEEAGQAVSDIIAAGLMPATIEMMDRMIVQAVEETMRLGLPPGAGAVLIIEITGYAAGLPPQAEEIARVLAARGAIAVWRAHSEEERARIWNARKSSAGALARLAPAYYPSDSTVPRSKIALALAAINRICEAAGLRVTYLLHAGDGNLHPHILIDNPDDPALMARVLAAEAESLRICVAEGGSITGEHGVGSERRQFMPLMFNAGELAAMREVKEVFDPQNLLNPGKIFPEPASAEAAAPARACFGPVAPGTVFAPATPEEASEAIRACLEGPEPRGLRIRGGGAQSAGLPPAAVTLSTAALRGLRAYAPEDLYVTVGAGTPPAVLQAALAADRLWAPLVSPWPAATIGGIVSTACNAPLRMRYGYGALRDTVLAVTAVLPDGRIVRLGRPVVKNVAGYDMPRLFTGAHGTLGLLADVTLKLAPLPRARASLVVPVDDVQRGLAWGRRALGICLVASAVLLCRGVEIPGVEAPYALVYTAEGVAEDVAAELDEVRLALEAEDARGSRRVDGLSGSDLWAGFVGRVSATGPLVRAGVAPSDLPGLLSGFDKSRAAGEFVADLAAGLLYAPAGDAAGVTTLRGAAAAHNGYAVVIGGSVAGVEAWGYVPPGLDVMRRLKARWDPRGVFNPGAFVV